MVDASKFELVLFFGLVNFHPFFGFKVNPLLLELVAQFPLGVPTNNHSLLISTHFQLKLLLQLRVLFKEALYLFLKLFVCQHPFVFLPSLLLKLALQLSFLISPLLLLLTIFLLDLFSQISLSLSLCFSLFPLIFPFILQVLQGFEVFLFEQGSILMQFSNLIIFELVGSCKLTQLLVQECNVSLIFAIQCLFFISQLSQRLLDIVYFIAVTRNMANLIMLQLLDSPLPVSNYAFELFFASLEFLHFELNFEILLSEQGLQFLSFVSQSLNQILIMCPHGLNIQGMETGQSFLHIVQLFLIFSFSFINLFLQQLNLVFELLSFLIILFQVDFELILQILYFCVFDLHEFPQTFKLGIKLLILLAHVGSKVSDLLIKDLLELVLDLVNFLVLLLYHGQKLFPIPLHNFLQTHNLVLFLTFYPLVFFVDCVISCRFLLDLLCEACNLKFILLFCLVEIPLDSGKLLLHFLGCFILFFGCYDFHPFLCLQCFLLPNLNFFQEVEFVMVVILSF